MSDTDFFEFSLEDRLRNVSLAPSAYNSMMPVIEAISNSIHSIEERFDNDISQGKILVYAVYDDADKKISGFRIRDNGKGFNDENYSSFKRADSTKKISKGGKGVGRLTWLKAFKSISVTSTFVDDALVKKRKFKFRAENEAPIYDLTLENSKDQEIFTEVHLENYYDEYSSRLFKKESSILRDIVRHFIGYLIGEDHVRISFYGKDEIVSDLHDEFFAEIQDEEVVECSVDVGDDTFHEVSIRQFLVGKKLRDQELKSYNHIYICGDRRPVKKYAIDNAVGLRSINDDFVYVSLISGKTLDESVNQERTSFSLDDNDIEKIRREGINVAKEYLQEPIRFIRLGQELTARAVVERNPRYLVVAKDLEEFVETDLKLSDHDSEEIELALTRRLIRKRNEVQKEIKKVKESGKIDEAYKKAESEYREFVTKETAYSLADYVAKRRAVIAAIEASQKFKDETDKYIYEEAIHNFICPIRSTTDDVDYDDHNLWLLDDRLAFYSYFHSDQKVSKIVLDSEADGEPDVTFFDLGFSFERAETQQPIVIVEFKQPSRRKYDKEDPVKQVMRYVRGFREGTIAVDKDGRDLAHIGPETQFHGIIVADLNTQLLQAIEASFVKQITPDGLGRFGYDRDTKTFIEIIPYGKLIRDAKARNEAFFKRLGID